MLKLYVDGACSPNPGTGGWACIFYDDKNNPEKHCGYLENTTNNIMEITSVIKGLQYIKKYTKEVEILTDSQYVVNTMTKGWKRNKNQDLWFQLDEELKNFTNIKWTWVKGHDSNLYNNICDELAVKARISKINY